MADTEVTSESAADVAAAIRQIAAERNALRLGGSYRINLDTEAYMNSVEAFSDDAGEALGKQSVTAISYNEARKQVYVYTTKRIPKDQASILPFTVSSSVKIIYRVARPLVINDMDAGDTLGAEPYELRNSKYACGSSIGIGNVRSAGTLGALVIDSAGHLYGLTNNHVSGGCNNARVGLPIVAPGIMDVMVGARDPFTVGRHFSVLQMRQGDPSVTSHVDNTDAALFRITDDSAVTSWQGQEYDTPLEVEDPADDMPVQKVGRTTKYTTGMVDSRVSGPFPVNYRTTTWHSPDDSTTFHGQVFFEPVYLISGNRGKPFSMPGDSGSLVVTRGADGSRKAVGLVFAGRATGESYMLPLRPILERFGVQLVSGHGG